MESKYKLIGYILILIISNVITALLLKSKKVKTDVEKKVEVEEEKEKTNVKEIMTPRTALYAIDKEETLGENLDEIIEQGFSRIPVYNESIDDICGILYIKDILKKDLKTKVGDIARKAVYIPETMDIYKLLDEFRIKQNHMAIIIDEYGGTSGIVTIEDILEEFVGEIRDEFDVEIDSIVKISSNIYDVLGETPVEQVDEEINMNIPLSEEYDTISGFFQFKLGKVAQENDQINEDNYVIKVMNVENKRIVKVRIILLDEEGENHE